METILDPTQWSEGFIIGVCVVGLIVAIVLNVVCVKFKDEVFIEGYNLISGGIWGLAILILLGLFIPAVNDFVSMLIQGMISNENIRLPSIGSIAGWGILIVCLVIIVVIWLMVETYSMYNNIVKLLAMLFFGAVHAVAVFFLIGIVLRMFVLAIAGFFVYCVVSGNAESNEVHNTTTKSNSELSSKKLYDKEGNEYLVSHTGEFGSVYIRDEHGNMSNVYKWNDDYYRDDKGNLYQIEE